MTGALSKNPVEWPVGRDQVGYMLEQGEAVLSDVSASGATHAYWSVWSGLRDVLGYGGIELLELGLRVSDCLDLENTRHTLHVPCQPKVVQWG